MFLAIENETSARRRSTTQFHPGSQAVHNVVAVVVAFFLCWAPFHAQRLVAIYMTLPIDGSEELNTFLKIYEITTYISGVLYYFSTTINPLLYNIMSNKFREAFKETFSVCCCVPRNKNSQRSYSVLSQSAQRGPDSADSGRYDPSLHTHTTVICRNSFDAVGSYTSNEQKCVIDLASEYVRKTNHFILNVYFPVPINN